MNDIEFSGREVYGHIDGRFENESEAAASLFLEELKKLMKRFDIVKIDVCYCPNEKES